MSIFLLMLWPFFCAFAIYFIPRLKKLSDNSASISEMFAIIGCTAELLLVSFLMTENVSVVMPFFDGIGLVLSFSGANAICCFIASLCWLTMTVFSRSYVRNNTNQGQTYFFSFLSLSCTIGYFLSTSFIASLLFFALGSIFTYPALLCGKNKKCKRRAVEFALSSVVSCCLIFFGMSLIHYQTESLTFTNIGTFAPLMNEKLVFLSATLIFLGFLIRTVFFPLLFRKTDEDNIPPLLCLSPLQSMIGLYGIFNVSFYMMPRSSSWHLMIMAVGCILLLSGALISLLSSRLDRMIIFALISNIGCMLIGISSFAAFDSSESIASCLIHLFSATVAFTLLLAITLLIAHDAHQMHTATLRGVYHNSRLISICFLSSFLGIAGVPAWSGYIGRAMIIDSLQKNGALICSAMLIIAGSFTVAALTRAYVLIFLRRPTNPLSEGVLSSKAKSHDFAIYVVSSISALVLPVFGIFPNRTILKLANRILDNLRRPAIIDLDILKSDMLSFGLLTVAIGALIFVILDRLSKPDDIRLADTSDFTAVKQKKGLFRKVLSLIYDIEENESIKNIFIRILVSLAFALAVSVFLILLCIIFIVVL